MLKCCVSFVFRCPAACPQRRSVRSGFGGGVLRLRMAMAGVGGGVPAAEGRPGVESRVEPSGQTRDREWTLVLVFGNGSSPIGFRQPCVTPGELSEGGYGIFWTWPTEVVPPPKLAIRYNFECFLSWPPRYLILRIVPPLFRDFVASVFPHPRERSGGMSNCCARWGLSHPSGRRGRWWVGGNYALRKTPRNIANSKSNAYCWIIQYNMA